MYYSTNGYEGDHLLAFDVALDNNDIPTVASDANYNRILGIQKSRTQFFPFVLGGHKLTGILKRNHKKLNQDKWESDAEALTFVNKNKIVFTVCRCHASTVIETVHDRDFFDGVMAASKLKKREIEMREKNAGLKAYIK